MNNNCPPSSNFQKSERETGNQVSLALLLSTEHFIHIYPCDCIAVAELEFTAWAFRKPI